MYSTNRNVFLKMTALITALNSLNFDSSYETTKFLDDLVLESKNLTFPLPSGCVGNVLALALEMHMFKGAVHLIINADRLGIDLENCSKSLKFGVPYNAKLIFEYAIKDEPTLSEPINFIDQTNKDNIEVLKKILI